MTSFHIITAGSSHTLSDTEQMSGLLKEAQFAPAENSAEADIVILNACTFNGIPETEFFQRLEQLRTEYRYKVIIIAGCAASLLSPQLKKFSLVGIRKIHCIVEAVEETLNGNVVKMLGVKEMPPLLLPRIRKNPMVGIIPITRGCFSVISKKKPGVIAFKSYSIPDIKAETEKAVREGVKEILLTSSDAALYGRDLKTNLPALLKELSVIPGQFKIRLGMLKPESAFKIKNELVSAFRSDKLLKFLYLPLHAGSNEILQKMSHQHTVEQVAEIISDFRAEFPEISIMTDITVGFPSETDEQHWKSLNVLRKIAPDIVNISPWLNSGGDDEKGDGKGEKLPAETVSKRMSVLTDICHNIAKMQNERWMGWKGEIIITEKGSEPFQWIGRNKSYKPIIVEGNFKLGDLTNIIITRATTLELKGELIK